jgi:hypothetical protein
LVQEKRDRIITLQYKVICVNAARSGAGALDALDNLPQGGDGANGNGKPANDAGNRYDRGGRRRPLMHMPQIGDDYAHTIISDSLAYGDVFGALERVTRSVGRKVNPTVYTAAEFSKRARTENAFVTRVLEQPKLWVIGSQDDLPVTA